MADKIYKFKNVKHSVKMRIIKGSISTGGIWLENIEYKGIKYLVRSMDELEEVKWIKINQNIQFQDLKSVITATGLNMKNIRTSDRGRCTKKFDKCERIK